MQPSILTLFDMDSLVQPNAVAKKSVAPKEKIALAKTKSERRKSLPIEDIAVKEEHQKNYYGIGETAKMFGVRASHIRFWTVQFALKVRTNRKGDRLYTPDNIELLKTINQLVKVEGFTIAGAKAKLKELKKEGAVTVKRELPKAAIVAALHSLRQQLITLRNQL